MVKLKSQKCYNRYYIEAMDNDTKIGRCYIETSSTSNYLELWSFYVDEKFRRKGIGTQMLQKAIAYFKSFENQYKSGRSLVLYVYKDNEHAINLYKRNGFEIIRDFRPDAYVMKYCA